MKRGTFTCVSGRAVRSVADFLNEINVFAQGADIPLYFRGHSSPSQPLLPSIGRAHHYLGKSLTFDPRMERNLLVRFRRHAYEHFGRVPSEWETLFLARHHGLPTRLLDWTSNPLVALYFATIFEIALPRSCEQSAGSPEGSVAVWGLQGRPESEELDVFNEPRSPLRIQGIKLVYPFNPTPRITAQSGIFTLHGDPWTDLRSLAGRPFAARDLDLAKLTSWIIPAECRAGIILDLERLAINSRTLFPDPEGLARGLWQSEFIRHCFRTAG